ncbi:MAG: HAMP domain-containing sensor histidine kinase [Kofleriaceae bacterium]
MTEPDDLRAVATPWPALAALAVVVVLSLGMLAVDLVVDHHTAEQTSSLVEDSLRSVALADDLRHQAYRLSTANLAPDQIASIAEQIDADARAYDPLANSEGEGDEWDRLQGLLAHLRHEQPLSVANNSAGLVAEIETSIARLVRINQDAARRSATDITAAHTSGLIVDAVVGVVTLALVSLVALVLVRALRRQRVLLQLHLASVDERTRELAAFASRTAHDLKGPLSPIRGYADLLSLQPLPEVKEMARRVGRAVDRMSAIIDDMLELSVHGRPVSGQVALTPAVLDAVEELRGELGDAEVSVELGELTLGCSATIFGQVLRNLITNAAKYRDPQRRLALRVQARRDGDRIEIAVVDNGLGMDAETQAHAFEPYYRATTKVPGHGLGLSIVRRTVEAIGGSVELASTLGEGTRVTVAVPAA